MRKFFYSLKPTRSGRYRKPYVAYAYIVCSDMNEFIKGAALAGDGLYEFTQPKQVMDFVTSLPDNSYIITYDVANWYSTVDAMRNSFDLIRGTGRDNRVLELQHEDHKWTVVDAFQFYQDDLLKTANKLYLVPYDKDNPGVNVCAIVLVWHNMSDLLEDRFQVYPSKTPGATAMKIYKRFLPDRITTQGFPILRLDRQAIRPPALHWKPGTYPEAYLYDLNAAYVHVMRILRYPKALMGFVAEQPPTDRWIARVKINYKTTKVFSPLSVTLEDGTCVYPTDSNNLTLTMTYIDLKTLEMCGDVEVLEWIEGVYWYPEDEFDAFGEWAQAIERISNESERNKMALKIVSRSLHSKFAPKSYYTECYIKKVTPEQYVRLIESGRIEQDYLLDDGNIAVRVTVRKRSGFKAYERPDWEALTTSMARYIMYSSIDDNTIYVHTDCIISIERRLDLQIGNAFGLWKLKATGPAHIAGLGLYAIGDELGQAGMKTNKRIAKKAIRIAAEGDEWVVSVLTQPGIFSSSEPGLDSHTVRRSSYPKAKTNGAKAFVWRSPMQTFQLKYNPRAISGSERERKLTGDIE